MIFVDVDDFKAINDAFGHSGGDEVLRSVADRIDSAVRPGDTVARFGGDEFVVVCDDVTIVEIEQVARRVFDAVCAPRIVDDEDRSITASLGVALADDAATPDSLLDDSDAAMYRAKALGRARIEVFDDRDRDQGPRRRRTVPLATSERDGPSFDRRSTTHERTD